MNEIIYPTLDLFLYDLRNGLGESQKEIHQNRDYFQKKLPESIHKVLFQKDTYFEDEYVELLTQPNTFETSGNPYAFQGYYYPVRLSDTYGLLLDCSVNNKTEPQPAESFKELKAESKLEFLEKFAKLVTDKYQLQITKDSENLERGMKLLENIINAVRSRVEVEKAERDRNFQDIITILGVGWSVASFVPSVDKLSESPNDPVKQFLTQSPLPQTWVKLATPLVYKVSIAVVAAVLAWLVIRLWPGFVKLIPLISKKK